MSDCQFKFLLFGHDTVECAYYLATAGSAVDFEKLIAQRDALRSGRKDRDGKAITLGGTEFLLMPYGSGSGFQLMLICPDYTISCGPNNNPSFFVKFSSVALWGKGIVVLHERFMTWAHGLGLRPIKPETLSRVDWANDYFLPAVDFDQDWFVSRALKDSKYRNQGEVRTFYVGHGGPLLSRVYDKASEIREQSNKSWMFKLWDRDTDVWRFETQARKQVLRRFGVRSVASLGEFEGDLLSWVTTEHTTLRIPTGDSNRSRWPIHPLWADLQERVGQLGRQGLFEDIPLEATLDEVLMHCAIGMYGYSKRVASIEGLRHGGQVVPFEQTLNSVVDLLRQIHEPLTWKRDVAKRMAERKLRPW